MITRAKTIPKVYSFTCDGCTEFIETQHYEYSRALAEMKAADWTVCKAEDEWLHHCPDCSRKMGID